MTDCLWRGQDSDRQYGGIPRIDGKPSVAGRVLHVVNGEHYAGAERVQDLLGGALPWFGYEAGIACVKPGQFAQARKNREVPLFECRMRGRVDLRSARVLVKLVRDHGYELLHAHTPRSLLVASAASVLARVPLIYHIHSPALADTTNPLRNGINAFLERATLAPASHLIAVSNSLRERYLKLGLSPERITVVSNGVPCGMRLAMRSRSPGEPLVFGMAALFRPRKGLEVLFRAMAELAADGFPFRLRAIGQFETPDYQKRIEKLAAELGVDGCIDWTGFSSDIDRELALVDCFVLPSLFGEGLPMVILEAMAAGRPVIATEVEGVPEAIHHGENGLVARPGSPASLAAAMKSVLDGSVDLPSLADRAAEDQRRRFSVCAMARRTAEIYDRVLHRDRCNAPLQGNREVPCAAGPEESSESSGSTGLPLPAEAMPISPEQPV